MSTTIARTKKLGKNFEIIVDIDEALRFKKGETESIAPEGDKIFTDSKKGFNASPSDLEQAFGTSDTNEVAKRIVKEGEVLLTQGYRDKEKEQKQKQIIEFLSKNAIDPKSGNPHSYERIKNALEEANLNIKNMPIENQISEIIEEISRILPIKIETKRIKVDIPAEHTGKAYGIINQYKEDEKWLENGSLEVVLNLPSGIILDFYDKLNSVTHGSAITEEIKE